MKVLKFGRNAIATVSGMQSPVALVNNKEKKILALKDIPVRMISYERTLQALSDSLF
jgi:hypothetical protein